MLTRKRWTAPNYTGNPATDYANLTKSISDYLLSLENKDSLSIEVPQLTLTAATGTAPLVVSSTTKVSNLNADLLDGVDSASFQLASGYTAADVLAKLLTVDGSGSGLDADLLDGLTGAATTYTPTLDNTTNVAASTAFTTFYLRLGPICVVAGKANIDPTAAGATVLGISLPVASNFSSDEQAAGVAALSGGASQESGAIYADATNDRVSLGFNAVTTTNSAWYFIFAYRII